MATNRYNNITPDQMSINDGVHSIQQYRSILKDGKGISYQKGPNALYVNRLDGSRHVVTDGCGRVVLEGDLQESLEFFVACINTDLSRESVQSIYNKKNRMFYSTLYYLDRVLPEFTKIIFADNPRHQLSPNWRQLLNDADALRDQWNSTEILYQRCVLVYIHLRLCGEKKNIVEMVKDGYYNNFESTILAAETTAHTRAFRELQPAS